MLSGATLSRNASNTIDDVSIDFMEVADIQPNSRIFNERTEDDGAIANTVTLDIQGGAVLRNREQKFQFGYLMGNLPFSLTSGLSIDGVNIDVDNSLTGDDLKKAIVDFVNNSGNGTLTPDGNIFAKIEDTGNVLILKDSNTAIRATIDGTNQNINFNRHLSEEDRTTRLLDNTLDLNAFGARNAIELTTPPPNNLAPAFKAINLTQIEMSLQGKAVNHAPAPTTFAITLHNRMFADNPDMDKSTVALDTSQRINFDIQYLDKPTLKALQTVFQESVNDDGSIDNGIIFETTNADFLQNIPTDRLGEYLSVHNLPTDITPQFNIIDESQLEITLKGQTPSHRPILDDINNISVSFKKDIFVNKANIEAVENIGVRYIEKGKVDAFPKQFIESKADDGSIDNDLTINIRGDKFSRANVPTAMGFANNGVDFAGLATELARVATTAVGTSFVANVDVAVGGNRLVRVPITVNDGQAVDVRGEIEKAIGTGVETTAGTREWVFFNRGGGRQNGSFCQATSHREYRHHGNPDDSAS